MTDDFHEELRPRDDNPEGISLFEIKARRYAAQEGIIDKSRVLAQQYDLDPGLLDDLEDAHRKEDRDAFHEAEARFLKALAKARGTD